MGGNNSIKLSKEKIEQNGLCDVTKVDQVGNPYQLKLFYDHEKRVIFTVKLDSLKTTPEPHQELPVTCDDQYNMDKIVSIKSIKVGKKYELCIMHISQNKLETDSFMICSKLEFEKVKQSFEELN